jgi:hypothetical protein
VIRGLVLALKCAWSGLCEVSFIEDRENFLVACDIPY